MTWRYRRPITLLIITATFLVVREWMDRRREVMFDSEIIREDMDAGDAHLGSWAQKNEHALIQFRLKRDGHFSYEVIVYPDNDTIRSVGWHQIVSEIDHQGKQCSRLIAVSDKGDTLINHRLYLMRATKRDVDILSLTNDSMTDAKVLMFRRTQRAVDVDELEAIQKEDEIDWKRYSGNRNKLTAVELIDLADCNDLACVQSFMKHLSPDFTYAAKGEYFTQRQSVIIDTAGNGVTIPLSTYYIDVNPQASWKAAHTVHTKALGDSLYNEFMQLGFTFVDEGRSGVKSNRHRYISKNYPGKSLLITATFQPWYFKGMYKDNVTWVCYVFEVYAGA